MPRRPAIESIAELPLEFLESQFFDEAGEALTELSVDGNHLQVRQDNLFRWLCYRGGMAQSAMLRERPADLLLSYTRAMMAFMLLVKDPRSVLVVGLGGGSLVKFMHQHLPRARITAVDRFPALAELATKYFDLPVASGRLRFRAEEAGAFLRRTRLQPDVIMIDIFDRNNLNATARKPEFYASCRARLAPSGVIVINLLVSDRDSCEKLPTPIRAAFDTILSIRPDEYGNFIVFACNSNRPDLSALKPRAKQLERDLALPYRRFLEQIREAERAGLN